MGSRRVENKLNQPKHFAIVTVVKNDLPGLIQTRKSLENQNYRNWTHIIIDGGSTDKTLSYIKTLPKSKLKLVSEPDSGIYNAMNKGWKLADPNNYVLFLNARDVFAGKESLRKASEALSLGDNPQWGCTTHEEIAEDGTNWVCKLVSPPSIANQLYAFGYRSHQAILMKAAFISELGGFNEKYKIAADWDLVARALIESEPATWVYPMGRFELGGFSSSRMLEAHLELIRIRKVLIWKNFGDKFFDDLWCAIYLRYFGYRNYLSIPISIFYPTYRNKKMNAVSQRRKFGLNIWFGSLGFQITILRRADFQKFFRISYFNKLVIPCLHRRLSITPYKSPNSLNEA